MKVLNLVGVELVNVFRTQSWARLGEEGVDKDISEIHEMDATNTGSCYEV